MLPPPLILASFDHEHIPSQPQFPECRCPSLCQVHAHLPSGAGSASTWPAKAVAMPEQSSYTQVCWQGPSEDRTPQGLTIAGAHVLAHGFGLEIVVVSFAATIDEPGAGILLLIVPPTMKKCHARARFFGHGAYVCRETPGLSNTSAHPSRKQLTLLPLQTTRHGMEQALFPLSHLRSPTPLEYGIHCRETPEQSCWGVCRPGERPSSPFLMVTVPIFFPESEETDFKALLPIQCVHIDLPCYLSCP